MSDGTPLPSTLTDNVSERVIRIDDALFYLIGGALAYLCDREPFEQTGTLTVDDAKTALSDMLEIFYDERVTTVPIGAVDMWLNATPPDKWLILNGAGISKTTYPELFALLGYTYGGAGDTFVLPTMASLSPMGVGGVVALGATAGNTQANISQANLPDVALPVTDNGHIHTISDPGHTHPPLSPATVFIGSHAGGAAGVPATATNTRDQIATTGSATTGIGVQSNTTSVTVRTGGSGAALNTLSPVRGVYFIIYAGH